jgi:hypothetical protein
MAHRSPGTETKNICKRIFANVFTKNHNDITTYILKEQETFVLVRHQSMNKDAHLQDRFSADKSFF